MILMIDLIQTPLFVHLTEIISFTLFILLSRSGTVIPCLHVWRAMDAFSWYFQEGSTNLSV